jgi:hypothetical protein
MLIDDSKIGTVLSSVAGYSTVNLLELMSLTPGLNDEEVQQAVDTMRQHDLIKVKGEGNDQFISVTGKGYNYLDTQAKMKVGV